MFIVKWSKRGKGFKKYKNTTLFMKYPQFCSSVGWMRTYVALYIFPCYNIPTYRGYFFLQVCSCYISIKTIWLFNKWTKENIFKSIGSLIELEQETGFIRTRKYGCLLHLLSWPSAIKNPTYWQKLWVILNKQNKKMFLLNLPTARQTDKEMD